MPFHKANFTSLAALSSFVPRFVDLTSEDSFVSNLSSLPTHDLKTKKSRFDTLSKRYVLARHEFVKWSQTSTAHGYPNMFRTDKSLVRIMWFVVVLLFIGVCAYFLLDTIDDFFSYSVNSRIRVVAEYETEFPGVTVCNSFMFGNSKKSEYLYEYFRKANLTTKPWRTLPELASILSTSDMYNQLYTLKQKMYRMSTAEQQTFGLNASQLMIYCRLGNTRCDLDNLEWVWDSHFGNCFRINSGFNKNRKFVPREKIQESGENHGLTLNIFDRLEDNDFVRISNIERSVGPSIVIYNQSHSQMSNYYESSSIRLRAGMCTNVRLSKVIRSIMPEPYSNCRNLDAFDSDLYDEMSMNNLKYRQKLCIELCKNEQIIKQCKCYTPFFPNIRPANSCYTLEEYSCSFKTYTEVTSKVKSTCFDLCPIECEVVEYDLFISYNEWPSLGYFEQLKKNSFLIEHFAQANKTLNYQNVKASMSCLNVFVDELAYTDISESASMTLNGLISNVGGTLGLFLGISLMSFLEIFELILEVGYILFARL